MSNELMHYGILGMKWGTRRAVKRSGTYKGEIINKKNIKMDIKRNDKKIAKSYKKYRKNRIENRKLQLKIEKSDGYPSNKIFNKFAESNIKLHSSKKDFDRYNNMGIVLNNRLSSQKKRIKDVYNNMKGSQEVKSYLKRKGYDSRTVDSLNKVSLGKAVLQSLIMGSYGSLKYNQARSEGIKAKQAMKYAYNNQVSRLKTLGKSTKQEKNQNRGK